MSLSVISNYAAKVAQRYLEKSDTAATRSIAKLSAGTRVLSARDDAASLAIGTKLSSDVASLGIASVNVGQASSMVQIADGALGTVSEILARMKTLAGQAMSGQLTHAERGMLQAEFSQLKEELGRTASSTTFNGTKLIADNNANSPATLSVDDVSDYLFNNSDNGIIGLDVTKAEKGSLFGLNYDSTGKTFTLYNLANGQSESVSLPELERGDVASSDESYKSVTFAKLGVSFRLDENFDSSSDLNYVNAGAQVGLPDAQSFRPVDFVRDAKQENAPDSAKISRMKISDYHITALKDFSKFTTDDMAGLAVTVNNTDQAIKLHYLDDMTNDETTFSDFDGVDVQVFSADGNVVPLAAQVDSQETTLQTKQNLHNGDHVVMTVHNNAYDDTREEYFRVEFSIDDVSGLASVADDTEETVAAFGMNVNGLFGVARSDKTRNNFQFQIGATSSMADKMNVAIDIIDTDSLGLLNSTIKNSYEAQQTLSSLEVAVSQVATSRARLGASANRLDFAAQNLATMSENLDAARSNLMDLNVAAEMSDFTAQQVLSQAGVSMLAQANQMPQNLLRLFR